MQDTDYIQNDLLERVFDLKESNHSTDWGSNQSIFNSPSEAGWNVFDECLPISGYSFPDVLVARNGKLVSTPPLITEKDGGGCLFDSRMILLYKE